MLPQYTFEENGFEVLLCELLSTIPKYSFPKSSHLDTDIESAIKSDYNEQIVKGFSCPVKM